MEPCGPTSLSASKRCNRDTIHKSLSIIIVVGRLSFQVRLLALVRCVDEAHDLRGLPGPDLRRELEFLRGRVEDGSYRAEPLQEVSGEGRDDARQPIDH